mmetsp:Transcript_40090/g.84174  ORF Transcript_40090/g.84174 Transcript_40090/m.84174 type:complete len:1284 (+) Transcript_40090:51-3902(+)|eukprot:CAMPEP_0183740018 /NCGR_PEP_ID=MMETSP0737-20130205/58670_1 /TAXON_ID=385413 /ORGANISM="Thalassiosira miniscula, Strain CCMP1093" /LENGTH=1283 /DNA_ID=CAMNT_0025974993 /DNA_START=48 /DNA_END=3899 /DNA_ORIENTATION=+
MDRVAAMLSLLGLIVLALLFMLALFSVAPIFCCCLAALLYILGYFLANESSEIHHAQEFENRFWTVFAVLLASAGIFVKDSPFCFGDQRPSLGMFVILVVGCAVHMFDRMMHRKEMNRQVAGLVRGASAAQSLMKLNAMGVSVEEQLERISLAMNNIDQLLVPSTINNFINTKFILRNEREIISIFEDAQPKMLNHLISNVKLALVFYKIKDHRNFRGQHRTELIEMLAVDRVSVLTVYSRVELLRALQLMKLTSNSRAEHWVRNIILSTHQDDLSSLKTMTDSKGDYFCMNKLIFDDIRSETVRQDILGHFRREANVQQAHMDMGTRRARLRMQKGWRKILSDVDDTLTSSGGSYPAGIDKRYIKRVVYPGVIGLYRELDVGIHSPVSSSNTGNLVFLSARPHIYKDVSEKHNFAKFQKLRDRQGINGRGGLHTTPSLLAGDLTSGREFMMTNDFEPLAKKKFDNFKRYVSIYPEYTHVFICDNGQGDVRAGELMNDHFPGHLEGIFVHLVQDIQKTHGFDAERWRSKGLLDKTCFFRVYPDAALYAATRSPPLIRMCGFSRVCQDAVADFNMILPEQWSSEAQKRDRRHELNQSLWRCNKVLNWNGEEPVPLIENPRQWEDGEKVRTSYGIGVIKGFDPMWDLYQVELDLRPLDQQLKEYEEQEAAKNEAADAREHLRSLNSKTDRNQTLQTVVEEDETNYLSPSTSFDASKKSSRQSLTGLDQGIIPPLPTDEGNTLPPTPESTSGHEFIFEADIFDRKTAVSPQPTLDETTGASTLDDSNAKSINNVTSPVPSSVGAKEMMSQKNPFVRGKYFAKIQGKDITKFTPPSLPNLPKDDKSRSKFSFWASDSVKGTVDAYVDKSKTKFSPGEKVATPYGVGVVVEHRVNTRIVVVNMSGPWSAKAYLQENVVRREGAGFLGTILRQFASSGQASPKHSKKERQFPHVVGTPIYSPYGDGTVTRPLPVAKVKTPSSSPKASSQGQASTPANTMAISLTSWVLRDGTHPTLYCTANSAEKWRNKTSSAKADGHQRESSLLSVIGSLVSGTVESLKKIRVPREIETPIKIQTPMFERYYRDGAAVTTAYGDGTVRAFRESDGFYIVALLMKSGYAFGTAYLREDSMSYRLARGCIEGYPVMTTYGSGVLQSVNPTTGVHNVFIPSFGAMCYLQPDKVLRPLKAASGEDVSTPYGEGKVCRYRLFDDTYEIQLKWGNNNTMLYAKAETFDRIDDRLEDKGGFGMGWILKFFYSREEGKEEETQRSRSNSFSMLSQSGVSTSMKSLR